MIDALLPPNERKGKWRATVEEEKKNDIHTKFIPGRLIKRERGGSNEPVSACKLGGERELYNIGNTPNQTQWPKPHITQNLLELTKQTGNPPTAMIANHPQASKTAPNRRKRERERERAEAERYLSVCPAKIAKTPVGGKEERKNADKLRPQHPNPAKPEL